VILHFHIILFELSVIITGFFARYCYADDGAMPDDAITFSLFFFHAVDITDYYAAIFIAAGMPPAFYAIFLPLP